MQRSSREYDQNYLTDTLSSLVDFVGILAAAWRDRCETDRGEGEQNEAPAPRSWNVTECFLVRF